MIRPFKPRIKGALMSADEVAEHNERVRRAFEIRRLLPHRRTAIGDVWVSLGKRYDPDPRQGVLTWNTSLYADLWGVG